MKRENCRLCGGSLTPKLSLLPTPIANAFSDTPDQGAEKYDLELHQCNDCGHVQLGYVLSGDVLYTGYKYETPHAMSQHLEDCAKKMRFLYPSAESVLEIGSNNGLNAQILRKYFKTVFEIDPGGSSVFCLKKPFTKETSFLYKGVDLIVANHVFAHIDDLDDVFDGVSNCLSNDGALIFEVQYFPDLVKKAAFDMIYHEHRDYHTLGPLKSFVKKHNLVMTDWEHVPDVQGGSIRVTVKKHGQEVDTPDENIDWDCFKDKINQVIEKIKSQISKTKEGIVAFGAAAKACTLIHQCGIADQIYYCVDDTPSKQRKYIPGTKIKIFPTDTLYQSKSGKVIFLTAWNYEAEVKKKHPSFNYIVPFT